MFKPETVEKIRRLSETFCEWLKIPFLFSLFALFVIGTDSKYDLYDFFEVLKLIGIPFILLILTVAFICLCFGFGAKWLKNKKIVLNILGLFLIIIGIFSAFIFLFWLYERSPYDPNKDEACISARYC